MNNVVTTTRFYSDSNKSSQWVENTFQTSEEQTNFSSSAICPGVQKSASAHALNKCSDKVFAAEHCLGSIIGDSEEASSLSLV